MSTRVDGPRRAEPSADGVQPGRATRPKPDPTPWLLAAGSFVLCLAYFTKWPTEWDSVQLTFGVSRFDIREGSPHPPGYWLYVFAGRLVRAATPLNAQHSLQLLAALAAAATVGLVYVVGRDAKNRWLGLAAAAFMATSPYLLFYGSTPASYCFDALLCVALLLFAMRARPGSRHGLYATALLALGSGLRPSSALILAPLVLWALVRSVRSAGQFAAAAAAGALGLVAWIAPMLAQQPGGAHDYFSFSRVFFRPAFDSASMLYGASWPMARHNMAAATAYTIAAVAFLVPVAAVGGALALLARSPRARANRPTLLLFAVAAAVPYLFLLFFYFGKGGYVLSLLPPVVLLALWPAASLAGRGSKAVVTALVAVLVLVQFQRYALAPGVMPLRLINHQHLFFTQEQYGAPFPLTHKLQRQTDRETDQYKAINAEFDASRDVVVYVWLNGAHRFRHGCFTMPEFRLHFVINNTDHFLCRHGRMLTEADTDIELPRADSRAVFTLDGPNPEVDRLVAEGKMQVYVLKTGRIVYVATGPGVTFAGVTTVVSPDHPLATHSP
jgi:hypothetical protein